MRIVADELIGARVLCQIAGVCCTGMGIGICHGWRHGAEGGGGECGDNERTETKTKCHVGIPKFDNNLISYFIYFVNTFC